MRALELLDILEAFGAIDDVEGFGVHGYKPFAAWWGFVALMDDLRAKRQAQLESLRTDGGS